jgi:hypothetical protein
MEALQNELHALREEIIVLKEEIAALRQTLTECVSGREFDNLKYHVRCLESDIRRL